MKHLMVRYRVKKEKVDLIKKAIREFVDAVGKKEPGTLVYEAFQEPDGVSFVHFMAFRDTGTEASHRKTPHTLKFVDVLYPNCGQAPVFTELRLVRSTRR